MTAPFVEIADGHRLFVRDWGQGAPVLLLAGWAMDSGIWAQTMLGLNARGLRTIAYDRRGHGHSSDPGTVDFDALADDLDAVITQLGLSDLTVVAHSCAVGEVLRYISRHGAERIGRIVLVGAQGPCLVAGPGNDQGRPREAIEALMEQLADNLPAWLEANIEPFAPGASKHTLDGLVDMVLGGSRRILIDLQRAIVETDLRPEATALRVPVTLIHGDRDVSAPLESTGKRFAALIPEAELLVYEDIAHGVMVTHAAKLARDIARIAIRQAAAAA
ncbi:alpha/beta fold hydrolase [Labrys neptuniae]